MIKNNNWFNMYLLAEQYYLHHHNLFIAHRFKTKNGYEYDDDGKNLGVWIWNQRNAYNNRNIPKEERKINLSPLTDEQVTLLEKIGMVWKLDNKKRIKTKSTKYYQKWIAMYQEAKKYYLKYNNLVVPREYTTEEGKCLSSWISTQRQAYRYRNTPEDERTIKLIPLSDWQVILLEQIGMIWDYQKERHNKTLVSRNYKHWMEMYNQAKQYYMTYRNLLISRSYITEYGYQYPPHLKKLGNWLSTQRQAYRYRNIPEEERKTNLLPLSDWQVILLEEIGMVWDTKVGITGKKMYDCKWRLNQCQNIELGLLSDWEIEHLKIIGFFQTKEYLQLYQQAFLEVFEKVLYYYQNFKLLPDGQEISPRLQWTYQQWFLEFDLNQYHILTDKQYFIWKSINSNNKALLKDKR